MAFELFELLVLGGVGDLPPLILDNELVVEEFDPAVVEPVEQDVIDLDPNEGPSNSDDSEPEPESEDVLPEYGNWFVQDEAAGNEFDFEFVI